jgi:hypothetical protein
VSKHSADFILHNTPTKWSRTATHFFNITSMTPKSISKSWADRTQNKYVNKIMVCIHVILSCHFSWLYNTTDNQLCTKVTCWKM